MTTILIIYLISIVSMYLWIKKAHTKEGIYSHSKIGIGDFFMIFCPLMNTSSFALWIWDHPLKKGWNND
tara:strand:- start:1841 stop:2047 length:207 start_codon:yes stop_codon:yes gene_type:complete